MSPTLNSKQTSRTGNANAAAIRQKILSLQSDPWFYVEFTLKLHRASSLEMRAVRVAFYPRSARMGNPVPSVSANFACENEVAVAPRIKKHAALSGQGEPNT